MNIRMVNPSPRSADQFEGVPDGAIDDRIARIPVLHLMPCVVEMSITNIVADQIKNFADRAYDWHVGGLYGVEENEPLGRVKATVVDFSSMARGNLGLPRAVRAYVREHGIKIIHTHTPRTTVVAALAPASGVGLRS